MRTDFGRAAKRLLARRLKWDINEQLVREVDCLMAENQVLKNQLTQSGKKRTFTDGQRRLLVDKAKVPGQRFFEVVTIVRPETILRWQRNLSR